MFLYAVYASSSGKPSSMLPSSTFLQDPMAHSTSQGIYLSASGHSVTSLSVGQGDQGAKGKRIGPLCTLTILRCPWEVE